MDFSEFFGAESVARVQRDVSHICDRIPSRLAGSEAGSRMARYSASRLREVGLEATVHEFPGLVSFPRQGGLQVQALSPPSIDCMTLGHSIQTPPEGVSGLVVDAGSGAYDDYAGKDVAGKIVLVELSYHPGRHEKQRIAAEKGAFACIMMNWGPPSSEWLPYGSVKPAWGNPTPEAFRDEMATLPCIGISRSEGLRLRQCLSEGVRAGQRVHAVLHTVVENGWRPVQVTTADLTVPTSDDFVVIGGHQDSWEGPQATDNAAGNACMLELARFFVQHRAQLKRGISFGFWTGHETGTMIGSTWYVDEHWERLRDHGVAYLQIDQPACAGTSRWGSVSNAELKTLMANVDSQVLGEVPRSWRRSVKVGDASFFGAGVPMFAGQGVFTADELKASANANLGWWHHTSENTFDKVQWSAIPMHLQRYAAYVWQLCTAPVIPVDFTSVAQDIQTRLTELHEAGRCVGIDRAVAKGSRLVILASDLQSAVALATARCSAGEAGAQSEADLLNDTLKRLSRLLLPICGTVKGRYGHDPYAYTPQTTMLPALYQVRELSSLAEGEQRWMLQTKLRREVNRLCDVLDDAAEVIGRCIGRIGGSPLP